ncbi:DUF6152 family protein [Elongatibacter sediminis]|uniref:DUF6152 family protein n=1 Tax=Elongatibacter sediminis TaxID=3119006 RepID=A0AAW9R6K1_9GAMM
MNRKMLRAAAGALVTLLTCGAAMAHHSGTMFDKDKEVTFTGVVKEFQYTNPHSWLIVDVTNEDGSVTTWGFEAEGPSRIRLSGVRKSDFPPGTKITITAHPMKDGRPAAAWTHAIRLEDGKEFDPWSAER